MIYDHLENFGFYRKTHPSFELAFDFLAKFDPATADGKYVLDGDQVIAHVQSYVTASPETKKFESHREYLDLQFVASGEETIYLAPLSALAETDPYNPEKDSTHYNGKDEQAFHMLPGYFAVLYPQDGHKVRCVFRNESFVKKVVLKILL